MRFRYFDSDGTEVEISSVDALKFRISTGAVTPETLLYDAAVERWAPAGRHQVFRFIVEEDEEALPELSREIWEEMRDDAGEIVSPPTRKPPDGADSGSAAAVGPAPSSSAGRPPPLPPDPERRDRETNGADRDSDATEQESDAAARDPDAADREPDAAAREPDAADRRPGGVEPEPETTEAARPAASVAREVLGGVELDLVDEEEDAKGSGGAGREGRRAAAGAATADPDGAVQPSHAARHEAEPAAAEPVVAAPGRADPKARETGSKDDLEIPSPLVTRTAPAGEDGGCGSSAGGGGRRSVLSGLIPSRRAGWAMLAATLVVAAGSVLLHLAEMGDDALAAEGTEPVAEADGPVLSVAASSPGGGTAPPVAGPAAGSPAADERGPRPVPAAELERLASEVAGVVSGDLARAMAELQTAVGVPERPPEAWLQGAYLAGADLHPEVREYWRTYGAFVTSVRALEEDLYRGFVQNRVLKMGLDTASAAGLSARVLERYERSAEKRELVYDDLAALADEALALHDTLADRSEAISYEPFSGRTLSRDPVIEAVADDPELAEDIWGRMDRIFERLDRVQGLQPVSTLRLQEALLSGLRIPGREAETGDGR